MSKPHFVKSLVCLAPLLFPGTASAVLFDYDYANLGFSSGGTVNDLVTMTVGGIKVDVTAYTITNDGLGTISAKSLLLGGAGVYVSSSSTDGNIGVKSSSSDGSNMDGGGSSSTTDLDEGLLFTFDQEVSLNFLNLDSFTNGTSPDDFNLTVDGVSILFDYNANGSSLSVTNTARFDYYYFNGIVGTEFLIWADANSDSFRIDEMKVSAVPVPAALWLFGSGLLGLFGITRRNARA